MGKTGRREPPRPAAPPQSVTDGKRKPNMEMWVQVAVGIAATVVVSGVGWLMLTTYSMNGTLSSVQSDLSSTNRRIERIATALPSVAHRIAVQETTEPASAVVIATKPVSAEGGGLASALHVLDPVNSRTTTYLLRFDSASTSDMAHQIRGIALTTERWAASLSDMREHLIAIHDTTTFPLYVDLDASYVMRRTSADAYLRLIELSSLFDSADRLVTSLPSELHSWRSINGELIVNQSKYRVDRLLDSAKIVPR